MGVGGATWDTAGTLVLGSDNTFSVADATEPPEDIPGFVDSAWWVFTLTQPARVVLTPSEDAALILYVGDDYAHRDDLAVEDFEGDGSVFSLSSGVTYHLLVVHDEFVSPTTYQVTWTQTAFSVSEWFSDLRERTDNQLISSLAPGLLGLNQRPEFQTAGPWSEAPVGTLAREAPSRVGDWNALQELGGPLVSRAIPCVWNHAKLGDEGSEGGWNDECSASPPGDFCDWHNGDFPAIHFIGVEDPGGPIAEEVSATIVLRGEPFWFAEIRAFLDEFGALAVTLDPTADGYPADSILQWEGPLELLKVELTGDYFGGRPAAGEGEPVTSTVSYLLRRSESPDWNGGDPLTDDIWTPWYRGTITWDATKTDLAFSYCDGPPVWTEVDLVVSGLTGWEGLADLSADESPDEFVTIGMSRGISGPAPDFDNVSAPATTAIRYTFRSPRYRWVYGETGVVRQHPRGDDLGWGSGLRFYPPPKAKRIVGGIQ